MVKEALQLLDELVQALARLRDGRPAGHEASARALEGVSGAVAATRAYLHDEFLLLDGSRESARWSGLVRLWRQSAAGIRAFDLARAERALVKKEGWAEARRWKKLDKDLEWARLEVVLEHCRWLRERVAPAPR
jgi:hypothetical protein